MAAISADTFVDAHFPLISVRGASGLVFFAVISDKLYFAFRFSGMINCLFETGKPASLALLTSFTFSAKGLSGSFFFCFKSTEADADADAGLEADADAELEAVLEADLEAELVVDAEGVVEVEAVAVKEALAEVEATAMVEAVAMAEAEAITLCWDTLDFKLPTLPATAF